MHSDDHTVNSLSPLYFMYSFIIELSIHSFINVYKKILHVFIDLKGFGEWNPLPYRCAEWRSFVYLLGSLPSPRLPSFHIVNSDTKLYITDASKARKLETLSELFICKAYIHKTCRLVPLSKFRFASVCGTCTCLSRNSKQPARPLKQRKKGEKRK